MVQDLMVACVERRFDSLKTPHPVERLSDNGSAYLAKDTRHTAAALGLRLCFTPVRSPQSPGSSADITSVGSAIGRWHCRGLREDLPP
jgi:transposase InsO family protein